jgi:hypothetical protein
MPKKPNHEADMGNKNIGTDGLNSTIKKNLDNKSLQIQQNKKSKK